MLTEINGNIDATYPIITGELTGYLGPIGTVTASADNSVGTPHVIVTQTPTPDGLNIDFAFREMGIPGLDLTVEQDLTEEQQQTARENIDAQEVLTFDAAPTQGSQNPVTSGGVYNSVADINAKIPAAASAQNKLADKEYVDDSINRTSAFFRGNFATYADLMAVAWQTTDPDAANYVSNNDYAFVAADETHSGESWRYIYVLEEGGQDNGWAAQYRVNESPLTPEQLAALNSGITSQGVSQIETNRQGLASHVSNTSNPHQVTKAQVGLGNVDNTSDANKPISTAQQAALDGKQDAISSTASVNSDKTPYLYRRAGGGLTIGNRAYSKLIGATIANNQLVQNGNFADSTGWLCQNGTISVSGNVCTATCNSNGALGVYRNSYSLKPNHVILMQANVKAASGKDLYFSSITNSPNYTATGNWQTISYIEKPATVSSGYPRVSHRDAVVDDTLQIGWFNIHDLTNDFGSTIADYAYTLEQGEAGAGIAWLKSYGFFGKYAPYDAGSLISTKAEGKRVTGRNHIDEDTLYASFKTGTNAFSGTASVINLAQFNIPQELVGRELTFSAHISSYGATSVRVYATENGTGKNGNTGVAPFWSSVTFTPTSTSDKVQITYGSNGSGITVFDSVQLEVGASRNAYEPYITPKTYNLGSDELRGLFKLDANNNIYADGDIKTPDGQITRKYGLVDLGTLNWVLANGLLSVSSLSPAPKTSGNWSTDYTIIVGSKLEPKPYQAIYNGTVDKAININNGGGLFARDSSYTDAATFKAAMSGVYLLYELATPTTEQGTPYQDPQEVFADGTEEYIDTRTVPVPVGHQTDYPGITYLVSKLGNETAFSPFASDVPPAPTSDGTYVLQVSVSSGTPFYRWVSAAELVGE